MALESGSRLGPYEILSLIGAGGMGEVYKAKDTRLDRTVAIKVLPSHLAESPERRERFEREARAVSSLNHPHICTLHDIGEQDGTHFLVMEYIEGETLADRLKKGPLPLDQALRYATEIADALDKAHRQGVVHRDLKPGNIMMTKSGAKLLDFGLAKLKASGSGEGAADLSALPTEQKPLTKEGSILGTFQYMAPEQLEGKEADSRTDIFAFGSVLYEMVTGKRAFEGKSQASLIGAIMNVDPPAVSTLKPLTPPTLDHVVKTCLAKDPDRRWQSAGDLVRNLEWTVEAGKLAEVPSTRGPTRRPLFIAALILIGALLAGIATWNFMRAATPSQNAVTRFIVPLPPGQQHPFSAPAISPDGRRLAFSTRDSSEGTSIWLRELDSLNSEMLPGTEHARFPFWSPDGRFLAFWRWTTPDLMKIDVAGGPPRLICNVASIRGGTWNDEGLILFSDGRTLNRVSDEGGKPQALTELNNAREEISHRHPQFLPDGQRFLYFITSQRSDITGTYVGSITSSEDRRLVLAQDSPASYAEPGYLLYVLEGSLMAQPFDLERLEASGEPLPIAAPVSFSPLRGLFSVSNNGVLVYREPGIARTQLVWFNRDGKPVDVVEAPEWSQNPELSPDGEYLAVESRDPVTTQRDIWVHDLSRDVSSRLTSDPSNDSDPLWSPDGKQIAFTSNREQVLKIYRGIPSSGNENWEFDESGWGMSWSPDGSHILYLSLGADLWLLPLSGDREPVPFSTTRFGESGGQFSPDGRWIAYESDESGQSEVYVQPFPQTGEKWQISNDGGNDARWRGDGKELFYLTPDRVLMSVMVESQGASFRAICSSTCTHCPQVG